MKYLKIFENKILDDILDKISQDGEKSLTSWEKDYLASFNDIHRRKKLEDDKKEKENKYKGFDDYDPRKDNTDFYKNIGDVMGMGDDMDNFMKNMSDDEYIKHKTSIIWDILEDDDMDTFIGKNDLDPELATKPWDKLSDDIKNTFYFFLKERGYLEK